MTKIISSPKRNVENIRRKNLEDNQLFLQKLLMTNIRNDFVNSARSILRKNQSNQIKKKFVKVEHATRYNEKVKSGEISVFVPEWQRLIEEKKKEAEKRLLEKERKKLENERRRQENERKKEEILFRIKLGEIERQLKIEEKEKIRLAKQRPPEPSKWSLFYKNNPKPYQRSFKPRNTKVGERIRQNLF